MKKRTLTISLVILNYDNNDLKDLLKHFKGVIKNDFCQQVITELQNNDKFEQHKFYNQQQQDI